VLSEKTLSTFPSLLFSPERCDRTFSLSSGRVRSSDEKRIRPCRGNERVVRQGHDLLRLFQNKKIAVWQGTEIKDGE